MAKLNPCIDKTKKLVYAKDTEQESYAVNCWDGSNPYGFSPSVKNALSSLLTREDVFYNYPQDIALRNAIVNFWHPYVAIDINRVLLTNGATEGLHLTNLLFQQPDASILGISPQYTKYIQNARLLGFGYRSVPLLKKDSYKFDVNRMLDGITSDLSLIYIDTPNDPTGQVVSIHDLRLVLDKARSNDICVIADEAFGDYLEPGFSAATLLNKYDNLIVIRSFSKGMGLAGIRGAYILTNEHLKINYDKISDNYALSEPARILARHSLLDNKFICSCRDCFEKSKNAVRENTGGKLHMAHTLDSCPILMMWHEDTTVNLASEFGRHGIKVCSGSDYENLAANSIRLRLPHHKHMKKLLDAIAKIN